MSPKYAFLRVASAPSQVTSAANGVPADGGSVCCASGAWLRPQAASSNRDAVTMRRNVLRLTACPHLASVRPAAAAVRWQTSHAASAVRHARRSEEHTSKLQSLMRISYAVFCLKQKKIHNNHQPEID